MKKTKKTKPENKQNSEKYVGKTYIAAGKLKKSDYLAAFAVFLFFMITYGMTACRDIAAGDSPELAAAAAVFGVPHPPGYPLYILLTGSIMRIFLFLNPAHAANLISGFYGAAALTLMYCFLRRLQTGPGPALFGTACLGTGAAYWSACLKAEVYSFDMLLLFLLLNVLLTVLNRNSAKIWTVTGFFAGLWIGHRPINLIYFPFIFPLLSAFRYAGTKIRSNFKFILTGVILSFLVFAYLPLASLFDPPIDILNTENPAGLKRMLFGSNYSRHLRPIDLFSVADKFAYNFQDIHRELGLALLFAPLGIIASIRRKGERRRLILSFSALILLNLLFLSFYHVLDISSFFLPSFAACGILAAFGADYILNIRRFSKKAVMLISIVLPALGSAGLFLNYHRVDLSSCRYVRQYGEDVLESAAPNGLLFAEGDTTVHALWYIQGVEKKFPDVITVSAGHLFLWHVEQLRSRYPEEDWPDYKEVSASELESVRGKLMYAKKMIESLGRSRPVYLTPTISRKELLGADYDRYQMIPKGLTLRIMDTPFPVPSWSEADWNEAFFNETLEKLLPLPEYPDMDAKSIYSAYALSVYRTARLFQSINRNHIALDFYNYVLRLEPDRYENDIKEAMKHNVRIDVSTNRLEEKSRKAIKTIEFFSSKMRTK